MNDFQPPQQPSPYAPPPAIASDGHRQSPMYPPEVIAKAEAIIKDASQFWLAIVVCLFCSAIGFLIIGPWFLFRLLQHNSLGRKHPNLIVPNSVAGSLEQRFQKAKTGLMIGAGVSVVTLLVMVAGILAMIFVSPQ